MRCASILSIAMYDSCWNITLTPGHTLLTALVSIGLRVIYPFCHRNNPLIYFPGRCNFINDNLQCRWILLVLSRRLRFRYETGRFVFTFRHKQHVLIQEYNLLSIVWLEIQCLQVFKNSMFLCLLIDSPKLPMNNSQLKPLLKKPLPIKWENKTCSKTKFSV